MNNNIYVEGEFLNHCNDCPFYDIETEVEFVGYEKNYHKCLVGGDIITGNCPLKPLSDRLAEERKKVVQEIREPIIKSLENGVVRKNPKSSNTNLRDIILFQMLDILDQIEGR